MAGDALWLFGRRAEKGRFFVKLESSNLKKQFTRFVIPSVVAQWVFALYTMVDGMFVARGVGETALAAVNLAIPFVNFVFAISLILAVGTSTIVSIHFGKKDTEAANRAYTQNFITVLAVALVFTALILFNLNGVANLLGATPSTFEYVRQYVGAIAAFSVFFMLAYYFEILIKAEGHPKLATIMVATGTVLNLILDYVFVFVVKWGIFGAAFATGLSQMVAAVFFICFFFSKRCSLRLRRFKFSARHTLRTLRLGLPSGITDFSAGMMVFLFNHAILKNLGEEAIVSYTIVAYVNTILVMSMTGVAQGMQPLASFYYGRGQMEKCNRLLKYAMTAAVGLSVAITVPTWLAADGIVSIFISPELAQLREYSTWVFRIFSLSFLLVGPNVVAGGYFAAVERAKSSMAISLARGFVFVALALWALPLIFSGQSIWWAPTLSEGLCLMLTFALMLVYRKNMGKTG